MEIKILFNYRQEGGENHNSYEWRNNKCQSYQEMS